MRCDLPCFTAAKKRLKHRHCVDLPDRLMQTFPGLKSLKLRLWEKQTAGLPQSEGEPPPRARIEEKLQSVERVVAHYWATRSFYCWVVIHDRLFEAVRHCLPDDENKKPQFPWSFNPTKCWRPIDASRPEVGYWLGLDPDSYYWVCSVPVDTLQFLWCPMLTCIHRVWSA